jgi:hypothetical protein
MYITQQDEMWTLMFDMFLLNLIIFIEILQTRI